MIPCAYCNRPLTCDDCGEPFLPPDPATYHSLSWTDHPIACPSCSHVLICRWCKTPYDGLLDDDPSAPDDGTP